MEIWPFLSQKYALKPTYRNSKSKTMITARGPYSTNQGLWIRIQAESGILISKYHGTYNRRYFQTRSTCVKKIRSFLKKKISFVTTLDLNKCLKHIKLSRLRVYFLVAIWYKYSKYWSRDFFLNLLLVRLYLKIISGFLRDGSG